jgi:hypothetical protein
MNMERVDPTAELGKILVWCSQRKATDLHTQADRRYSIRDDGTLQRIAPEQFPVPNNDDITRMLHQAFSSSIYERIEKQLEIDLSFLCAQLEPSGNGHAWLCTPRRRPAQARPGAMNPRQNQLYVYT